MINFQLRKTYRHVRKKKEEKQKYTNPPLKWNYFLCHNSLWTACLSGLHSSLRCGHVWSDFITPWSDGTITKSLLSFLDVLSVDITHLLAKLIAISLLDAFSNLVCKQKSNKCALGVCKRVVTAGNLCSLQVQWFSRMYRKGGITFCPKDFAQAILILSGNNKLVYFLNATRMNISRHI